jgi:hypothetical protein
VPVGHLSVSSPGSSENPRVGGSTPSQATN